MSESVRECELTTEEVHVQFGQMRNCSFGLSSIIKFFHFTAPSKRFDSPLFYSPSDVSALSHNYDVTARCFEGCSVEMLMHFSPAAKTFTICQFE